MPNWRRHLAFKPTEESKRASLPLHPFPKGDKKEPLPAYHQRN